METDLIISQINEIQRAANEAFEQKKISPFMTHFDEQLKYSIANGSVWTKKELGVQTEKFFSNAKQISKEYYRVKSSFENGVFVEKIASKIVINKSVLAVFSKKQTIQTEEVFHWKEISGQWRVTEASLILEEKY
ncbi:hypothetical protein ACJVDH_18810 [Pedobacter sp. AW1-32]|uniref:hypothetical protein n=1 Tax=Pedobacter sp. AW1-32 TaxID=3383026 RepID=UPI003FEF8608